MATDISVIVDPAEIVASVTIATGAPGATGAQGPAGADGADGADGSDASVTASNIAAALGGAAVITTDARLADARTPTAHNHPLSDLSQSSATSGQVPSWNGTAWVPTTPSSGGGGNPFDQSLNTTDDVLFNSATATEGVVSPVFFAGDFATGAQLRADATLLLRPSVKENWEVLRGVVGYDSATNNLWYQKAASGARKRIVDEDFLAWNNVSGKPNVALTDSANTFVYGQTITAAANTSALTATYSVTGANTTPLLDLSGTWNTTGVARGILLNVTSTQSAATSLLADFQVGGTTRFNIDKAGHAYFGVSASASDPIIRVNATPNASASGIAYASASWFFSSGGANSCSINGSGMVFGSGAYYGFGTLAANPSAALMSDGANILAVRAPNAYTAGQTLRVYNTYTDSANYERGFMRWNSNVLEIGTEAGGTGTGRNLQFVTNGTTVAATASNDFDIKTNLRLKSQALITSSAYGKILMTDAGNAVSGSPFLLWGGSTSAFPSIKRSGTTLQVRLADDSAFTALQGKLTTDTAYTATMIIPTGYVTIYDSTGTAYKVACSL